MGEALIAEAEPQEVRQRMSSEVLFSAGILVRFADGHTLSTHRKSVSPAC